MPRVTILPKLSNPPAGYTWDISRIQGHVGGKFGDQGYIYNIKLKQNGSVIIDQRFFISKSEEAMTVQIIQKNEERVRKLIRP